eukprot:CAMPEP_0119423782 /NCGR_PEP_ID=MMETSP1335-20130426/31088_1 /TAXON_ID=259385 /ORGANISM="Chrysoculter rhomboideus, Strain RCC1486" /LENGTH=235 /DNA_ID=CAMNT_0007449279 /DNA_START=165 /DNA_END=870 /DNA_ORIENTATION=+
MSSITLLIDPHCLLGATLPDVHVVVDTAAVPVLLSWTQAVEAVHGVSRDSAVRTQHLQHARLAPLETDTYAAARARAGQAEHIRPREVNCVDQLGDKRQSPGADAPDEYEQRALADGHHRHAQVAQQLGERHRLDVERIPQLDGLELRHLRLGELHAELARELVGEGRVVLVCPRRRVQLDHVHLAEAQSVEHARSGRVNRHGPHPPFLHGAAVYRARAGGQGGARHATRRARAR